MAKYHINDDGPAICRAGVRSCPVGGTHFDSLEEADSHYENILAEVHGGSFKKKNQPKATLKDFDSWHPDLSAPLPQEVKDFKTLKKMINIIRDSSGGSSKENIMDNFNNINTTRLIDYYMTAARTFNLVDNNGPNNLVLTDYGKKYVQLTEKDQHQMDKTMISSLWKAVENTNNDYYSDETFKRRIKCIKKLSESIGVDLEKDKDSYVSKRTQEIIDNGEKFTTPRRNINNFENSLEKTKEICPECFMDKRTCLCEDD